MNLREDVPEATGARTPLCFVLMPFGVKRSVSGAAIEFDAVYEDLLAPAIRDAGLEPLRADQELIGGMIHRPMFERLVLADYAVADLTTANPNVFYELGVRHAARPFTTVLVSAESSRIPFDLAPDRVLPYRLDASGAPAAPAEEAGALTAMLREARKGAADSPVYQLIDDYPQPDIDRLKTDTFRDEAAYSSEVRERLAAARAEGPGALAAVRDELGPLEDAEVGVLIDLLLSFRATKAWEEMISLVAGMPRTVSKTVLVREQFAFALNRAGQREKAEEVLLELIEEHGESSETLGLLGRVYKDRWDEAREEGSLRAAGLLKKAIDAYRRGFEADWRDAYPGVNAVTLMEIEDPGGEAQQALLPVVRYANERRMVGRVPDYWDHATRLELATITRDQAAAERAAGEALAAVREPFEPETTARNLSLIRESRSDRGEGLAWAEAIERELLAAVEGGR